MLLAFAKKDKAKTIRKDKSICFVISKQNAITTKQYITDGFIDHLFYLFVTFYSRQPVTANGLSTCNSPSPHQSLSIVAGQLVEVYSGLSCRTGALRRQLSTPAPQRRHIRHFVKLIIKLTSCQTAHLALKTINGGRS